MNEKLAKAARAEGFCCLWAFLKANRGVYTSELAKKLSLAGFPITARAIRHQRRKFRRGTLNCPGVAVQPNCLTQKLLAARKNG